MDNQTKKPKRDSSMLLLEYPQLNTETPMSTKESFMIDNDHPLEGVNLQAIVTTCQAQRCDTIPPDQLKKIE